MPLKIDPGHPAVLIKKDAYDNAGLSRVQLDSEFNLTAEEFRVEGQLIVVGPLPSDDWVGPLTEYLEKKGLTYFDDFFELSGNWPEWVRLYVNHS